MTSTISTAYRAISELDLWMKIKSNSILSLSDVPAVIKSRYGYIIKNWHYLRDIVNNRAVNFIDMNRTMDEIDLFDIYVKNQINKQKYLINENELISEFYNVFSLLYISDIQLTKLEYSILEKEIQRVTNFNKNYFLDLRKKITAGRDVVADYIGGEDSTYNYIYNRRSEKALLNKSIPQINIAYQFHLAIIAIEGVLVNEKNIFESLAGIDPFAFARANANNPDIDIRSYNAGFLVKLNYGESLQTLALRTLNDENRWLEIAIANGLKSPYIDEIGERLYLTSNASGNKIIIPAESNGALNKEKLYINQIVILRSDIEKAPEQRLILDILEVPISNELVIELDGAADLDKYRKIDNSYINIYKKNTINSNFFILIPQNANLPEKIGNKTPWFLRSKGEDEKKCLIDLALNDDGDLIIKNDNDFQLSYGLSNAMQAVRILLSTSVGSMPKHPEYGISDVMGRNNMDMEEIKSTLIDSIKTQISNDSRFDRVEYLNIYDNHNSLDINLGIVLNGGKIPIPINFQVNIS